MLARLIRENGAQGFGRGPNYENKKIEIYNIYTKKNGPGLGPHLGPSLVTRPP